ncbi:MAG TPA: hypothetical protein VJ327_11220 [Patescibacteria group bacterium]|nr:hypothetical protein [Patescibacteria group bacterium]
MRNIYATDFTTEDFQTATLYNKFIVVTPITQEELNDSGVVLEQNSNPLQALAFRVVAKGAYCTLAALNVGDVVLARPAMDAISPRAKFFVLEEQDLVASWPEAALA